MTDTKSISGSTTAFAEGKDVLGRWWPGEALDAVRVSLTVIAAIWLAMWLELSLPHWAGWTVLSVTLSTRAASLRRSLWRAGSTIVGVAASIALVANFAQATLAFDLALALWLGLLTAASSIESGQRSYGLALMGFTVPIVVFASVQNPESVFQTGVDRCSTILLGVACAYASGVLVAPGVTAVSRALADRMEFASDACARWIEDARRRADPGPMPIATVTMLDESVGDAFSEHPSLRSGGRAIRDAASRLRWVLAAELLRGRLGSREGSPASSLIGDGGTKAGMQLGRVRVAARLLRRGERIGRRRASMPPHLLFWNDRDWDGRHAIKNALRTVATVLAVNAFWYATGWIHGSSAATWSAFLAVLLASHPQPASEARNFLIGTLMAAVIGLVVRYTLLTMTGEFALLAAILLPVCILAVLGRSDGRAAFGFGYAFFVLAVVAPTNIMTYDLASSLNQVLAELLGIGAAAIAFSALLPPIDEDTRRMRARRRLIEGVRRVAVGSSLLLPPPDRWLARSFERLALIEPEVGDRRRGETLLLSGLLLLALRRGDGDLGREAGRIVWSAFAGGRPSALPPGARLRAITGRPAIPPLDAERVVALASLVTALELSDGTP
jgi:hypothetical protein